MIRTAHAQPEQHTPQGPKRPRPVQGHASVRASAWCGWCGWLLRFAWVLGMGLLHTEAKEPGETNTWWSLRPLTTPALPPAHSPTARGPIDRFLQQTLHAKGLEPSPEADRLTLLRRVTFDLTGLPPTPAERDRFLRDKSPGAYEQLVDRLLGSPRYGERWARHWIDVAHWAETHGHDQDRIRTNAWPYRDYLVDAFNSDLPYTNFIRQQIAADVLYPREPKWNAALGFLAAGPWDESSLRDIREDSIDRQIGFYIDRDDMLTTVMSSFASSSVHCARCHDHKTDPISQADYYNLQAVFAGVGRAERQYDLDADQHATRYRLRSQLRRLEQNDPTLAPELFTPELRRMQAAWIAGLVQTQRTAELARGHTMIPRPTRVTALSQQPPVLQPDLSLLAPVPGPDEETFEVQLTELPPVIHGLRLELLPDDSLPSKGPGRNENGNVHLTELECRLVSPSDTGPVTNRIAIARAHADFSQVGYDVRGLIDGKTNTSWAIHPEVGRAHEAILVFGEPVRAPAATTLLVTLVHQTPKKHTLGRFRIGLATSPVSAEPFPVPYALRKLLPQVSATAQAPGGSNHLETVFLKEHLMARLKALPEPRRVFAGTRDFDPDGTHKPVEKPRPVFVLRRGEIHRKGAEATPAALRTVADLPPRFELKNTDDEGERRAALANWLAAPGNPWTWRSIVNRVWHHHFGRGIVDTPNDFGRLGSQPTHPELLDWLATTFRDQGGSLKWLHRQIVLSHAYRQASAPRPEAVALDADNRLLWRMERRRLDAESLRDAMLATAGSIDLSMGGPGIKQFGLAPGSHVTPRVDYTAYDWSGPGWNRRSIYRFLFRTLPDPFMDAFDCADASQLTPVRNLSITPLQALSLLNNRFTLRASEALADRARAVSPDLNQQVAAVVRYTLLRDPESGEALELATYAARHGLPALCRMIYNSNEFMFVD